MPTQPLQPFSPPSAVLAHLPVQTVSPGVAVQWFLYLVFAIWLFYTLIIVYHWLKYSHGSWLAVPSIATHLFISFAIMAFALSGALA